jgi:putative transferase (TIGR04331 family)
MSKKFNNLLDMFIRKNRLTDIDINQQKKNFDFKLKLFDKSILITDEIINQLSFQLNILLKKNKSHNYWKIILTPYVSWIVSITYPLYVLIEKRKIKKKKIYFKKKFPQIRSFEEFSNLTTSYEFNKYIFFLLMQKNQIKFFLQKKKRVDENYLFLKKVYSRIVEKFSKKIFLLKFITLKNIIYHLIYYRTFPYAVYFKKKILPLNLNINLRKSIKINFKNNYLKNYNIENIIQSTLPTNYLENFDKNLDSLNLKNNFTIVKNIGEIWSNDYSRFLVAEKLKDIKIISYQHGGSYEAKLDMVQYYERRICDEFLCWGPIKNKNKEKKIIPINLQRIKNCNLSKINKIILPMSLPSHILSPISSQYGGSVYDIYINDLNIFLNHLDSEVKKRIVIRLQPQSYKNIYGRSKIIKDLKQNNHVEIIEPNYNFKKDLINYSFCVTTVDSTNFLETLVSNIPFICYWNKNFTIHHSKSKNIYNRFYKSKLFCDSPIKASNELNKIFFNKEKFWRSKSIINTTKYLRKNLCNIE